MADAKEIETGLIHMINAWHIVMSMVKQKLCSVKKVLLILVHVVLVYQDSFSIKTHANAKVLCMEDAEAIKTTLEH